ncbi:MAG: M20/M25/M40 family metallo-hydrolase [Caldilineaceae bacterium]
MDAFAAFLADRFRAVGANVQVYENETRGNHVAARVGHADFPADVQQALVLCHYDTVWPVGSLETHPFRVDDEGKAYGPGIFDMQSSLMLSEYALRAVKDLQLELPRPVTVLMTSDEEVGSGSLELIEGAQIGLRAGHGIAVARRRAQDGAKGGGGSPWRSPTPRAWSRRISAVHELATNPGHPSTFGWKTGDR